MVRGLAHRQLRRSARRRLGTASAPAAPRRHALPAVEVQSLNQGGMQLPATRHKALRPPGPGAKHHAVLHTRASPTPGGLPHRSVPALGQGHPTRWGPWPLGWAPLWLPPRAKRGQQSGPGILQAIAHTQGPTVGRSHPHDVCTPRGAIARVRGPTSITSSACSRGPWRSTPHRAHAPGARSASCSLRAPSVPSRRTAYHAARGDCLSARGRASRLQTPGAARRLPPTMAGPCWGRLRLPAPWPVCLPPRPHMPTRARCAPPPPVGPEDGPMRLWKGAVAGGTVAWPPWTTVRMPGGPEMPHPQPAPRGTGGLGADMPGGINLPRPPGGRGHRLRRPRRRGR